MNSLLERSALAGQINDLLPQTQCTRCGFPDCASYAVAIAEGSAAINQCPPGGAEGIARLSVLTGQAALPLNPLHGVEGPRSVAVIDEAWCIGCTLCLPVCPTDAILGSNKLMHTVIEAHCTGCELCIPVCPVDCISLENVTGADTGWKAWSAPDAAHARSRYEFHLFKLVRGQAEQAARQEEKIKSKLADLPSHTQHTDPDIIDKKRAVIEAALARSRARRGQ